MILYFFFISFLCIFSVTIVMMMYIVIDPGDISYQIRPETSLMNHRLVLRHDLLGSFGNDRSLFLNYAYQYDNIDTIMIANMMTIDDSDHYKYCICSDGQVGRSTIWTNATEIENPLKYGKEHTIIIQCHLTCSDSSKIRLGRDDTHPLIDIIDIKTNLKHDMAICSSAVWGITTIDWIIEWLVYHKTIGFTLVHLYVYRIPEDVFKWLESPHTIPGMEIVIHDWSLLPSQLRNEENYEHAQRMTRNSCYHFVKSTKHADHVLFTDIDELLRIENMEKFKKLISNGPSATMISSITFEPFGNDQDKLFIEQFSRRENHCHSPYNCGEFHHGRQKYIMKTGPTTSRVLFPLFYHAPSRNYKVIREQHLSQQCPEEIATLRHFAGHFIHVRYGGMLETKSFDDPIPMDIITPMRLIIGSRRHPSKEKFLGLDHINDRFRFIKRSIGDRFITYNGRNGTITLNFLHKIANESNRRLLVQLSSIDTIKILKDVSRVHMVNTNPIIKDECTWTINKNINPLKWYLKNIDRCFGINFIDF